MNSVKTLEITTPTDREIVIRRDFNAPRPLVFDCWTKPELLKRWLFGPDGWSLAVCEVDLRVGGAYRFEWRHENGENMGMGGVYRDVSTPGRLVTTELFDEDWTGGETQVTLVLTERGEGTTSTTQTIVYSSREARDAALQTGMAEGMEAGYLRLDEYLASLASAA